MKGPMKELPREDLLHILDKGHGHTVVGIRRPPNPIWPKKNKTKKEKCRRQDDNGSKSRSKASSRM